MNKILKILIVFAVTFAMAGPASANITAVSGNMVYNPVIPDDLTSGACESNSYIYVFNEEQNLTLLNNLSVDIAVPGTYDEESDLTGAAGTIGSGTIVNSYIVHVDPVDEPSPLVTYDGSITFSNKILGLIVKTSGLTSTDGVLGISTTSYDQGALRGLEFTRQDTVQLWLAPDGMTLHLEAGSAIDEIRVVEAIPAPGAILLGSIGAGLVGWLRRRRTL